MNLNKAILFTGKIEIDKESQEIYQLLVNCNYTTYFYNPLIERNLFYEEANTKFVEGILKETNFLEIGNFNGAMINPETKAFKKIQKLEEQLVNQFLITFLQELNKRKGKTILVPSSNN